MSPEASLCRAEQERGSGLTVGPIESVRYRVNRPARHAGGALRRAIVARARMAGTGLAGGMGHVPAAWPRVVKLPGRDAGRRAAAGSRERRVICAVTAGMRDHCRVVRRTPSSAWEAEDGLE